jgi:hypothetical protein
LEPIRRFASDFSGYSGSVENLQFSRSNGTWFRVTATFTTPQGTLFATHLNMNIRNQMGVFISPEPQVSLRGMPGQHMFYALALTMLLPQQGPSRTAQGNRVYPRGGLLKRKQ